MLSQRAARAAIRLAAAPTSAELSLAQDEQAGVSVHAQFTCARERKRGVRVRAVRTLASLAQQEPSMGVS